jgi:hypothetical protein
MLESHLACHFERSEKTYTLCVADYTRAQCMVTKHICEVFSLRSK